MERTSKPSRTDGKHKRAKEAPNPSEARLRLMFDTVSDGIVVTDLSGIIIEANEKAVERSRVGSREELIGKSVFQFIAPHDHEKARANMRRNLTSGPASRAEYTLLRADGSEFIGEVSANSFKNAAGEPVGFITTTRGITDRKRAEEALRKSEERYRSLVERTHVGIATADREGKFTFVNNGLCDILGYSEKEMLNRSVVDFLHPDERSAVLGLFLKAPQLVPKKIHLEFRAIHKKGHLVHMSASPTRIMDGNKLVGFSSILIDITRLKETEDRLLTHQKELRSLASQLSLAEERERRRIAVEIHDRISQTLAFCRMKLGALMESAPSCVSSQDLEEVQSLLKQLIEETRSLTFQLSSPLLYEVSLEAAVERLTEQMKERYGVIFSFKDDGKPKSLDDDIRVLLFQTVRELLLNVAKHARAHRAKVSMSRQDGNIRIVVQDDGDGFDASHFNAGGKRSKGFGLFSIRERLHYIGGQMAIESIGGRGTRVTVIAPLKQSQRKAGV